MVAAWAGGSVDTDGTSVQGTGLEFQRNSTGGDLANRLLGDGIYGHAGNDTLLGLGGDDIRYGGLGDDSYSNGTGLAKVIEANGQGTDTVISRVSHALAANIEVRHLMEQDAINGKVNGLANRMDGNSAANLLDGGAGNRALFGGSGNDPLQGGGDDYLEGGAGGCCCARQDPSDAKPRRNGAVAFF